MFKNWKTSLIGIVGGVLISVADGLSNGTIQFTLKGVLTGIVVAALGLLAKDFTTTGIGAKATSDPAKDGTKPTNLAGI
jgi:hypothetical protein